MHQKSELIGKLIAKHIQGDELTDFEKNELHAFLAESVENQVFFDKVTNDEHWWKSELSLTGHYNSEIAWQKLNKLVTLGDKSPVNNFKTTNSKNERVSDKGKKIFYKKGFEIYTVFSVLIIVILLVTVYYFTIPGVKKGVVKSSKELATRNIAPGSSKVILELADGSVINLDNYDNKLLRQGATNIRNQNGQLIYMDANSRGWQGAENVTLFNTLRTSRGGEYKLQLPDGSRVWLNALSSIRFPVSFPANERRVEITGEAYFEIASFRSGNLPAGHIGNPHFFVVINSRQGKTEVEVTGTHFNIKAYDDEDVVKATLLEGAVTFRKTGIRKNSREVLLKPGQQAQFSGSNGLVVTRIDTVAAVAWKNGKILLNNTDIISLMRQIERWYDVHVEYRGNLSGHNFTGVIWRADSIKKLINILEYAGLHIQMQENKMIITP